jgi:hypothetical protein
MIPSLMGEPEATVPPVEPPVDEEGAEEGEELEQAAASPTVSAAATAARARADRGLLLDLGNGTTVSNARR